MVDRCVMCGREVPEGVHVCSSCRSENQKLELRVLTPGQQRVSKSKVRLFGKPKPRHRSV